jgi:hypothetical protein
VSRRVVVQLVLAVLGPLVWREGVAASMDYDVSCLNFPSGKKMRSGNIGNSCRALVRLKLCKAIKHYHADSRSALSSGQCREGWH